MLIAFSRYLLRPIIPALCAALFSFCDANRRVSSIPFPEHILYRPGFYVLKYVSGIAEGTGKINSHPIVEALNPQTILM